MEQFLYYLLTLLGGAVTPVGDFLHYVFLLQIRQAYVDALIYIVVFFVFATLAIWLWRNAMRMKQSFILWKKKSYTERDSSDWESIYAPGIPFVMLGSVLCGILALVFLLNALSPMLNPELYALNRMVDMVKSLRQVR